MTTRTPGERRRISPESSEQTLVTASRALTRQLDVQAACAALIDGIQELVGATSCLILLKAGHTGLLRRTYGRGVLAEFASGEALAGDGTDPVGVVFHKSEMLFVADLQGRDLPWVSPEQLPGIRPLLFVPLVAQNEAVGVVVILSPYLSQRERPRADDMARLEVLAAQGSIAIRNASFYEQSEEDRQHLQRLLEDRHQLRGRVHELQKELHAATPGGNIVGVSAALQGVFAQVQLAGPVDVTVLLLGETGTGKELLARALHDRSRRASRPFVAVNCAGLPESLVESELFGHERGAFTDAGASKAGRFEVAHQGTLFMDEVGELSLEAQAKVLRALQDGEIQRVGATRASKVDVRVIAATNVHLAAAIRAKRFRSDLYYRLNVFPIAVPPLRDRREDIPVLAMHFLRYFAARLGKNVSGLDREVVDRLLGYHWPGNVRELQNVIERAVLLSSGPTLRPDVISIPSNTAQGDASSATSTTLTLEEAQRRAVLAALTKANWQVSGSGGAAHLLGLKATTLHAKMKKLGIRRPPARPAR